MTEAKNAGLAAFGRIEVIWSPLGGAFQWNQRRLKRTQAMAKKRPEDRRKPTRVWRKPKRALRSGWPTEGPIEALGR
jgi:hypothetical protein